MKIKGWFYLLLLSITTFLIGIALGCWIGFLYTQQASAPTPAYYCDPSTSNKRVEAWTECLRLNQLSIFECDELSRKMYGIAGFKRRGRILPCIEAETPEEKKVCGDIQ